jgi:hypothetical protein
VIQRSDRVQVWASQLWANDFPPICAMTGRPAETWRKFKFSTPPTWAYILLFLICLGGLGLIAYAVTITLVAQRASGYLPLTRTASQTVSLTTWVPGGLLIATVSLWFVALVVGIFATGSTASTVIGVLLILSVLTLLGGLVGRLVVKPLVCPRAKVMELAPGQTDRIVELRNVSAPFVDAVRRLQQGRAAQYTSQVPNQFPPQSK